MKPKLSYDVTHIQLTDAFEYDHFLGRFKWKTARPHTTIKAGDIAGSHNKVTGYRHVRIGKGKYLEHRLVWFYVYKVWPNNTIDHVNADRSDNRIENLREASPNDNQHNRGKPKTNTSGYKGVSWCKRKLQWHVSIKRNNKNINIGYFDNILVAANAYKQAAHKYHGDFARFE